MFVTPGESEPTTVSVYALRNLNGVTVKASPLRNSTSTNRRPVIMSVSAWKLRSVENLDKRKNYASKIYYAGMPTYLEPLRAGIPIPQGETRSFWLDLRPPVGTAPGLYRGSVAITADGVTQNVPVTVNVLPFQLKENPRVHHGLFYTTPKYDAMTRTEIMEDMANMAEFGMNTVGMTIWPERSDWIISGTDITIRTDTFTTLVFDCYRDFGFPQPIYNLMDQGRMVLYYTGVYPYGDPRHDQLYLNANLAFKQIGADRDWPEMVVQPMDEVSWAGAWAEEMNLHYMQLLESIGIKSGVDGEGNDYLFHQAGPLADVWVVQSAWSDLNEMKAGVAAGKVVTIYNFEEEGWGSETQRWARGLYNWCHGLGGDFTWCYQGVTGSSYDIFDSEYGDTIMYYPPEGGRLGGPSVGMAGGREGIDDRKYMDLLEETIAAGKLYGGQAAQIATQAESWLADVRVWIGTNVNATSHIASWEYSYTRAQAEALGIVPPGSTASAYIAGKYKMAISPSWTDFDDVRWNAATYICRITSKMNRLPRSWSATRPRSVNGSL